MALDGRQIREVTPQGVIYLDENGEEKFIDFAVCYENYVRRMTIPEYWERHKRGNRLTDADWENHVERVKHWKEVGIPDIGGMLGTGRPYIQFHTEPPIRFEFATEEEFQQAQGAIRRARWKTTDLS